MRKLLVPILLIAASLGTPTGTDDAAASPAPGSTSEANSDFNGDGFDDVAIGVPFEDVGVIADAGGVEVMYGTAGGLSTSGDQFWTQDSPGVTDQASTGDRFGWSLAPADFNGDGFADLAVGVPFEDLFGTDEGAVQILYGSATGLQALAPNDQVWRQGAGGVEGDPGDDDRFGFAVATGDFDADGFADLAIGARGETVGDDPAKGQAGAVEVIYGSSAGLQTTAPADQLWSQDSPSVKDEAESFDEFGRVLACGDFNGDGRDDLAVGVMNESLTPSMIEEGAVTVLYGSASGIQATAPNDQFWTQNSKGVGDSAEGLDLFGAALAAGDLGNGPGDDLAIGVPGERAASPGVDPTAGAVAVLYGSAGGLQATDPDDQLWTQDVKFVADQAEDQDEFGSSLAIGDLGKGATGDLVIGVPGEDLADVGDHTSWGAVHVLYGTAAGLTTTGSQFWTQDSTGVADEAEAGDQFGYAVAVLQLGVDSRSDLVIGAPWEDLGIDAVGAFHVLYGSSGGVTTTGSRFLSQNSPGVEDQAEEDDAFGFWFG